ncbi:MAG: RidA family protein [Desulfobacterales bacterium]|jgi:enamine deaminase RidA (YjgF/YER057c/UK114 family)
MREIINPKNVHWPFGYTHVCKIGDTVHVSGQLALDQEGKIVGEGDMILQTEKTYENLKKCLESVGATINDIVMLRIFVTDLEAFQKTGDIRKKYFGKYRPVTTGLEISRLYFPEALIEVEATAVIGSGSSEESIKPKSI